jgi:hypothetical protein
MAAAAKILHAGERRRFMPGRHGVVNCRNRGDKKMTTRAKGEFEVKLDRLPLHEAMESDTMLSRMSIDKHFTGDLAATSRGEMLAAMTAVKGSAGYVAVEEVIGTLNGRSGTFVLQHSSTMDRGVPVQNISVVPDSGTGELTGIEGQMVIIIEEGKHFYEFDYSFRETS